MPINFFHQTCFTQKGFYLFELLITMVVMSIGMLGIAGMLLLAHKTSSSSYLRQQATQSAYNIIEKMRANRQAAINGSYNVSDLVASGTPSPPSAPSPNCDSASCNANQMAAYDSWYWLARDVALLPNGAGSVTTTTVGTNTQVRVIVQWNDAPAQTSLGAGGEVSGANAGIAQVSIGTLL